MFAKRQWEYEQRECNPEKRFRHNMSELFFDNSISADRALSLFEDAQLAGKKHVKDLAKPKPYKGKSKFRKNASRDLRRRLLKGCHWPKLYYANIRVWDTSTQSEKSVKCPFMLPRELVHCLRQHNDKGHLLGSGSMTKRAREHLQSMSMQFGSPESVGLGLWVDGAPCNWDRTESLECVSLNLPGLLNSNKAIRLPLTVIHRSFVFKEKTFEDILDVISWSMAWLAHGLFPNKRHDGSSFGEAEKHRQKTVGQPLGLAGFFIEMRGDWKMYAEVLKVPVYNTKTGCCFKCNVKPNGIRDFSSQAIWRSSANRLNHWQFANRLISDGKAMSNLFKCPGFNSSCICLDWLHVVDLGIAAGFLGNLFWLVLPYQSGTNRPTKVSGLFQKIQEFYRSNHIDNRLNNLTELMIRKDAHTSPKLRASASEARALIPFGMQEALVSLDANNVVHKTAQQAAMELNQCYSLLLHGSFNKAAMEMHSINFCTLYHALEQSAVADNKNLWRVKPKMHLFQELCLEDTNPADQWTYRDEDFGGYLAGISRSRGGKATVCSVNTNVLDKFRSKFSPKLRP